MQVLLKLRWNNDVGRIEEFEPKGWRSHPAVLMWKGYEPALLKYQQQICAVWTERGHRDTCYTKTRGLMERWYEGILPPYVDPPWLGDEQLHRSHQSNLVRKDPEVYGQYFPEVPDDEPYVWPLNNGTDA